MVHDQDIYKDLFYANPFRYRGYYQDSETGFYYCGNRYYDPAIGRFINADSIMWQTGGGYLPGICVREIFSSHLTESMSFFSRFSTKSLKLLSQHITLRSRVSILIM